jgi:plasmid rolling circle replication initiator protein Rep
MKANFPAPSQDGAHLYISTNRDSQQRKCKPNKTILANGKGFDLADKDKLKKRAKKKQISGSLAGALLEIAQKEGNEKLEKVFRNTKYCMNTVQESGNMAFTKYCKNRTCTVCQGIRKAAIIENYLPTILEWDEVYFVTLTVKSVPAYQLRAALHKVCKNLNQIIAKYKKRQQRGQDFAFIGIRSLECNFNPKSKTYNPHFHLMIKGRAEAKRLVEEWVAKAKKGGASFQAQNIQQVKNREECFIEIVKYGTKIFTDVEGKKRNIRNGRVYVRALYKIIEAMQGIRLFERFGFNTGANTTKWTPKKTILVNPKEFEYDPSQANWIETTTGKCISDDAESYIPNPLKDAIDMELC